MVQHVEIKSECYYDVDAVRRILGLSAKAIGNACRANELRFSERGGRRFFRGAWLISWLEDEITAPAANEK
ncbi:MAG: helix-turn-helix domain-containing protein [Planctomycetales bacterium]|nr:helix-turn-helix domain-containing protein [Planctomycetales bacterium]